MNIIRPLYQRLTDLLQLFYPPVCLGCQTIGEHRNELQVLCNDCLHGLKKVPKSYVREEVMRRLNPCYLDDIFTIFVFNDMVQILIHEIKYRRAEKMAMRLADYACKQLNLETLWKRSDLVVPVPLYSVREKERGFNQSQAIARGFFPEANFSSQNQILIRAKPTQSQTELNREQRLENVYEAFKVSQPALVQEKNIVLVDDVLTTGATLNECARVLKESGTNYIWAITLAAPVED